MNNQKIRNCVLTIAIHLNFIWKDIMQKHLKKMKIMIINAFGTENSMTASLVDIFSLPSERYLPYTKNTLDMMNFNAILNATEATPKTQENLSSCNNMHGANDQESQR